MKHKRVRFDLHTHSRCSDGVLTAEQLCGLAAERGLDGLSLTDHDTMDGIASASAAAKRYGLSFLPGVEISTACHGVSIHILGYGVHEDDAALSAFLDGFRKEKLGRAVQILQRLTGLGMPLEVSDLPVSDLHNLGRAHIARAMASKGYVSSMEEAFSRFLLSGRPAYVPKVKAATDEAIGRLRQSGAVAVLAHPEQILLERTELMASMAVWIDHGLGGVEAYHPSHSDAQCRYWDAFARTHALLVTGGSDFHEDPPNSAQHGALGSSLSRWSAYPDDISKLLTHTGCNDESTVFSE